MQLTVPLTGTVLVEGSLKDGALVGSEHDPIRPLDGILGNVSWNIVSIDLDNAVAIVEVNPPEQVYEPSSDGDPIKGTMRPSTQEEKVQALQYAKSVILNHTKEELYQMGGNAKLRRPFKR